MSLPPSGYPKIRGKACGEAWARPTVVTGLRPNTGFGSQFKHTVQPIIHTNVLNIGDDREQQEDYASKITARIDSLRERLDEHLIGDPLRLGPDHRKQIEWLLTHAEAELEGADHLWNKWSDRVGGSWPLSRGDDGSEFMGGVCGNKDHPGADGSSFDAVHAVAHAGKWYDPPGRTGDVLCPSPTETLQRPKDRKAIGFRFFDALAHVYCAEFGYWRLRLYKEAYEAYKDRPTSGPGDKTVAPGTAPPKFPGPGSLLDAPLDPCTEFGMGCGPGEAPEGCPSGFCPPDPEDLPDPGEIPELDDMEGVGEGHPPVPVPVPETGGIKPWHLFAGGATVLVTTGIVFGVMSARR